MNRVCIIYKDPATGTLAGKAVSWANLPILAGIFTGDLTRTALRVVVQHQQDPEPIPPNEVSFSGHEVFYLKDTPAGLRIRSYDPPAQGPEEAKDYFFREAGTQDLGIDIPSRLAKQAGGGMDVQILAYDWQAPDYDDLDAQAAAFDLSACENLDP